MAVYVASSEQSARIVTPMAVHQRGCAAAKRSSRTLRLSRDDHAAAEEARSRAETGYRRRSASVVCQAGHHHQHEQAGQCSTGVGAQAGEARWREVFGRSGALRTSAPRRVVVRNTLPIHVCAFAAAMIGVGSWRGPTVRSG